jgi:hypothetical protein
MKDPFEVMPRETAVMFEQLKDIPYLNDFVLIGGTGLALRIGHRRSEDLDFITVLPTLPRAKLMKVEDIIRDHGHTVAYDDDATASDDFENAGMDIRDHSQEWLIDGKVRMTFFAADEYHKRILGTAGGGDGFRVGSLAELCELKAIVASSRSRSRDWIDLLVLERDHGFGLAKWKEAYDKGGLSGGQFEMALKRICEGQVSPRDEGFEALIQNAPSLKEVATHFRALRDAYEIEMAKGVSRGETEGRAYPDTRK